MTHDSCRQLARWLHAAMGASESMKEGCILLKIEFGVDIPGIDLIVGTVEALGNVSQAALNGEPSEGLVARQHVYSLTQGLRQRIEETTGTMAAVSAGPDSAATSLAGYIASAAVIILHALDRIDAVAPKLWPDMEAVH